MANKIMTPTKINLIVEREEFEVWKNDLGARVSLRNQHVIGVHLLAKRPTRMTPPSSEFGRRVEKSLEQYLSGKKVKFDFPLDLSGGTKFQTSVWKALLKIPFGETRSYGELAKMCGRPKAARAVGNALGANPIPIIIPCHRIIAGDGSLGGFSSGPALKRRLLSIER